MAVEAMSSMGQVLDFDVFEVREAGWYNGRSGAVKADSRFQVAKTPAEENESK